LIPCRHDRWYHRSKRCVFCCYHDDVSLHHCCFSLCIITTTLPSRAVIPPRYKLKRTIEIKLNG